MKIKLIVVYDTFVVEFFKNNSDEFKRSNWLLFYDRVVDKSYIGGVSGTTNEWRNGV